MTASAPQLSRARRVVVLLICSMSLLIVGLDVTIVNVALPAIHRSLHASFSGLQWTIDAYTLVLASLLLLSGSMADRIGRRRVFQIGLVLFSAGSLACALAPSLDFLIAFRVVQAIGGSMLNPVAMSIIRNVFEDPRERAQAIGVWGAMVGVSMALGPIVGGSLVDSVGWQAVFLVNVPIGALALIAHRRVRARVARGAPAAARPSRPGARRRPRSRRSRTGSSRASTAAGPRLRSSRSSRFSLSCFVALVRYELRRDEPLIEIRFFRSAPLSGASAIAVLAFAGLGGFLFLNTLYLQDVRGLSPFEAGLYTLPMAGATLVFAPLSGRLVGTPRRAAAAASSRAAR